MTRSMSDPAPLIHYTIYDHPEDFPDDVVIVLWDCRVVPPRRMRLACRCADVAGAREWIRKVAPNAVCFARDPTDEECIVETWF